MQDVQRCCSKEIGPTSTPRRRAWRLAVSLCLAVLCGVARPGAVRGAQIASNINENDAGPWGILDVFWSGVSLTTDANAWQVDSIVAAVAQSQTRSIDGIFAQIYSDLSGQPNAPLGSKFVPSMIENTITDVPFSPVGAHPLLQPNTTYWVVVGVDDPTSSANPVFRVTDTAGGSGPGLMPLTLWSTLDGGASWDFQDPENEFFSLRMQLNGTVVPEPSAFALGSLALLGLSVYMWRSRRAGHCGRE